MYKFSLRLNEDKSNYILKEEDNLEDIVLNSVSKVVDFAVNVMELNILPEEHCFVIVLDNKLKTIGYSEISHGTINSSILNPREIFMRVLLAGGSSFIIIHNHPSGISQPSKEDLQMMKKIKDASTIMSISMSDFLVIGKDNYFSGIESKNI